MERARHRKVNRIYPGRYRIGNQRERCRTCNNFSQAVMRLTRSRLIKLYADEYQRLRLQVEHDLYPQVIQNWETAHPWASDPAVVEVAEQPTVEVPVEPEPASASRLHRVPMEWAEEGVEG